MGVTGCGMAAAATWTFCASICGQITGARSSHPPIPYPHFGNICAHQFVSVLSLLSLYMRPRGTHTSLYCAPQTPALREHSTCMCHHVPVNTLHELTSDPSMWHKSNTRVPATFATLCMRHRWQKGRSSRSSTCNSNAD